MRVSKRIAAGCLAVLAGALGACGGEHQCMSGQWDSRLGSCVVACSVLGACGGDAGDAGEAGDVRTTDAVADVLPPTDSGSDTGAAETGPVCTGSQTACGSQCVELQSDLANCGQCGMRCTAPAHGQPSCAMGACGVTCDAGYELAGGACDLFLPRPLAPLSTSQVTSQQPTLRWLHPSGSVGARVELCRDRAMTRLCQQLDTPVGTSAQPAAALAPGWWFWRVRGLRGGEASSRTGPVWQFQVGPRSAPRDTSWGSTPDLDGDGYAELIVGAYGVSMNTGRAYVYRGSAGGVVRSSVQTLDGPDGAAGNFGSGLSSAGDVNGDGYGDLLVGADYVGSMFGRAYLFYGGPMGVAARPSATLPAPDPTAGFFGFSTAGLGDIDGDGFGDVAVGALAAGSNAGRVHVFRGSAAGLALAPSASFDGPDGPGGTYGDSIAALGDVNGDGLADVAISAPGVGPANGRVYLYVGSARGLVAAPIPVLTPPDGAGTNFGAGLGGAGDVNGDGYADLVIGAYGYSGRVGRAYVYLGGPVGLPAMPAITLTGLDGGGANFGSRIAGADLNGDGFAEVIVSAPRAMSDLGRVHVFAGSAAGTVATPLVSLTGISATGLFGLGLGVLGDVDGDGFGELALGAPQSLGGAGGAFVFPGSAMGPRASTMLTFDAPDGANGAYGYRLALRGLRRPERRRELRGSLAGPLRF